MNREQMIAWLTLEGFRPMKDARKDTRYRNWRGLRRSDAFYIASNIDGRASTGMTDKIDDYPTDYQEQQAEWDDFPNQQLRSVVEELTNEP